VGPGWAMSLESSDLGPFETTPRILTGYDDPFTIETKSECLT